MLSDEYEDDSSYSSFNIPHSSFQIEVEKMADKITVYEKPT